MIVRLLFACFLTVLVAMLLAVNKCEAPVGDHTHTTVPEHTHEFQDHTHDTTHAHTEYPDHDHDAAYKHGHKRGHDKGWKDEGEKWGD
jgi:hypothetical protein